MSNLREQAKEFNPKTAQNLLGKRGRKHYKAGWGRKAGLLARRVK